MQTVPATTSGAGLLQNSFSFQNPSSATDFSTYTGIYDEYRVLAMEVQFMPNAEMALTTNEQGLIYAPILSVVDHDSNANFTTNTQPLNFESCKIHSLTKKWSRTMKIAGLNAQVSSGILASEGAFMNCTAPPSLCGAIKIFTANNVLSVAATYGVFLVIYRVQFRGHAL